MAPIAPDHRRIRGAVMSLLWENTISSASKEAIEDVEGRLPISTGKREDFAGTMLESGDLVLFLTALRSVPCLSLSDVEISSIRWFFFFK